jgi:hypothetical protein
MAKTGNFLGMPYDWRPIAARVKQRVNLARIFKRR